MIADSTMCLGHFGMKRLSRLLSHYILNDMKQLCLGQWTPRIFFRQQKTELHHRSSRILMDASTLYLGGFIQIYFLEDITPLCLEL